MKITDLKCALIGRHPIVRITTDDGIDGFGQVEHFKSYLKPQVLLYRDALIGEDPTLVERTISKIRPRGAFKPWGAAVSAIEHALWDIAGKAAGLPVHKLLGGKVRDRVRIYNGAAREKLDDYTPKGYRWHTQKMLERPEGFTIVKQALAFHSPMKRDFDGFYYADPVDPASARKAWGHEGYLDRGVLTERGLKHIVACVEAMKEVLGDRVGLALDCGPGFTPHDALRLAKVLEPYNLMWLEDLITGDYTPFVNPDVYRDLTMATSTPIHTGEQIYLRQNFKGLIESRAVNVIGPDPCDVGGIAELKWIAEYADLHGIQMAPHGTGNGLLGLAALVQMSAALPMNYIAFEYPTAEQPWWPDIVEGLPDPIAVDGHIAVWDRPGMGVTFRTKEARKRLGAGDKGFFD